MKRFLAIILAALFMAVPFSLPTHADDDLKTERPEMRGLWVTTAYNLDWPSRRDLTPAQIRAEIDGILARSVAQGINAVFVQVRPAADAFYNSNVFPWSHLLTGTQGVAPAGDFSPLAYWIEAAHALGVEVHAWLNPFRVTFPNQRITDPSALAAGHPARLDPSLVIAYRNGLFFDPGNPAARQVILDGIADLLTNYNVDGIHLDDYFYPGSGFPDGATFARYGAGSGMNIHDWRRENVNTIIRDIQETVRATRPRARFGVSPFAIWKNAETDPLGSATRGLQSYYAHYADTRRWVLEGWVDYIVPQIYWPHTFAVAPYDAVLTWWEDLVRGTDVDLYVGLSVYREVEGRAGWAGEIVRQLERNAASDVVSGSLFFRTRHMDSAVGDAVGAFFARTPQGVNPPPSREPTVQMQNIIVAQPAGNRTMTNASGFWFYGSAVPGVPVFVNGTQITDRTAEGFWSIFMPLARGANTFTFTQEGQQSVTRVVTNNAPAAQAPPVVWQQAQVTSAFPNHDEWHRDGSTITLSATAPGGATVYVELGGQRIRMTQTNATIVATAGNIRPAAFTAQFTLNTQAAADAVVAIGRPVYTMTWNGQTISATAAGTIHQIGRNAPFFAEVTGANTWAFPGHTTVGGSSWMLPVGAQDRVTSVLTRLQNVDGRMVDVEWARLASGGWVQTSNLRTFTNANLRPADGHGFISEGRYIPTGEGEFADVIIWNAPFQPATWAEFDGDTLIFAMGVDAAVPQILHNIENTMFSEIRRGEHNGSPAYFMTLREDARLEGFFTEFANGELRLYLRHRRTLARGNYPFAGFTFVLDPGHGGTDPGALGPMGALMPESHIVLEQALQLRDHLEMLGAEVIMTRTTDTALTLQQRVNISRAAMPDMFISLHSDATAETTDATRIRGFTVWYRNASSIPAAENFLENLHYVNPHTNRHRAIRNANFFVVRPVHAPSVLFESSFTNNIHDFAWLINPRHRLDYTWGIVNALLRYYAQ